MRRRELPGPAVPERLCRFIASEWPGDAWPAWKAARLAHARLYPASQLGDVIDVLRGHVEELRRRGYPPNMRGC